MESEPNVSQEAESFVPRAHQARIDPRKLYEYALNPEHELGKHKARVFESALAVTQDDWRLVRDQVLARLPFSPVEEITDIWGQPGYRVLMEIEGNDDTVAVVDTRWLVPLEGTPRLISIWVAT